MNPRARSVSAVVGLLVALSGCRAEPDGPAAGSPPPPEGPVVLSLLGETLHPREDSTGAVAVALDSLAASPDDVELILAAGHAQAGVWDYVEAIRLYNRAVAEAPDDWRGYRFRGHRYMSIRRLPTALTDLEIARDLSPHSFDVAYHLGLAYYLAGVSEGAADEYGRCMALARDAEALALEASGDFGEGFRSCMSIATSDNTRVAITNWRYLALRRSGRHQEAETLLDGIDADMDIGTNAAYHAVLLFYKGMLSEEDLLAADNPAGYRLETVGYPVAAWHLAEGDTARALALLEQVAAHPHWPGFGRMAAESDLAAMRRADVR